MKRIKCILVCGLVFFAFAVSACREKEQASEVPASEETVSEAEEGVVEDTSVSESDIKIEESSEEQSEEVKGANSIDLEEGRERLSVLVEKYPEINRETLLILFSNFNTYTLNEDAVSSFFFEYNKSISLWTIFQDHKFDALFDTYAGDFEVEYNKTFDVSDFVVNAEARAFAEEVDDYFSQIAYTEDEAKRAEMNGKIEKYINGENEIFSQDFVNPSECTNDFATTYVWIVAYYATFMEEDNAELRKMALDILRKEPPVEIRFNVDYLKRVEEYWNSPEGKKAAQEIREEASKEANN